MSGSGYLASTPAVELGLQLKAERERPRTGRPRGYTKSEVPRNICSARTLLDVEKGWKRTIKRGLVRDLCAFYETDRILIENLVKLADATYMDEWTDAYASVVDKDDWLYLQREDRASRLTFHNSIAIPSLIQPRSYIEMLQQTTLVSFEEPNIDWSQAIRFREARRRRWLKSKRPARCLIGEAAFKLNLGAEVAEDIRRTVLELAQLPFVDMRVIPFSAGRYELIGWEVSLLDFSRGEESLIRTKVAHGGGFVSATSRKGEFFCQGLEHAMQKSVPVEEYLP